MTDAVRTTSAIQTEEESAASKRISIATQWQLMWWRFRKHRMAMLSAIIILLFYVVVIFADFFAYTDPTKDNANLLLLTPQPIHWYDGDKFSPHVFAVTGKRDPKTFKKVYKPDPKQKVVVKLVAEYL